MPVHILVFPGDSVVKNSSANIGDTGSSFLGQEDSLEKEMATYSNIHAWEIPRTEEPGGPQSTRFQRSGHNLATKQQQVHTLLGSKMCDTQDVYQKISSKQETWKLVSREDTRPEE